MEFDDDKTDKAEVSMFGADRGRLRILGDIISPPDDIDWDAWADEQYELYYKDLGKPAS